MNSIENIDTFIFLVNIENYINNCKKILEFLKEEKELAKLNFEKNKNNDYLITLNHLQFVLDKTGTKGYSFILSNDNFNICIAEYISNIKNCKPIKIRISSQALWQFGLENSYNYIIKWIEETFGKISQESVYRIDLACHNNNDFITNYDKCYKGLFKKKSITLSGNKINAICFGSRKNDLIYCRIYNKSLEIKETRSKTWFKEIWQNNNLDITNVWNLEFEIKSEFLREKNLTTFQEVYDHIQTLWKYCTTNWLSKVNLDNSRISRCSISNDWIELREKFENFSNSSFVNLEDIEKENAQSLLPTLVGYLTSYSSNKNLTTLSSTLAALKIDSNNYFKSKNTTFEQRVLDKIKLKGDYTLNDKISHS